MSAAPRTARGTRTRAKLLQAAETVFASVGYHEASIVKITEAAGVGLGTFYLYFEGKQAIFDEVVEDLNRRVRHAMTDAARTAGNRLAAERAGFRAFFRFTARAPRAVPDHPPGRIRLARARCGCTTPGSSTAISKASRRRSSAAKSGEMDPTVAAWALMGIGELIGMRWVLWDEEGAEPAPGCPPGRPGGSLRGNDAVHRTGARPRAGGTARRPAGPAPPAAEPLSPGRDSPMNQAASIHAYRTTEVEVRGGTLHTAIWGPEDPAAPTILAVHGVTASHKAWPALAEALPDIRIIAPDLRGRGRSNALPAPYGMPSHAEDLAAVLAKLSTGPVVVVGHSMGAFAAVVLANLSPERVRSLVLVDGGLPLQVPAGLSDEQIVAAVLGPAAERLNATFPSREVYRSFWKQHPAFTADWSPLVEEYVDYDLTGEEPVLRPATRYQAMADDTAELHRGASLLKALDELAVETLVLRAPRGLLNEPGGLYAPGYLDNWAEKRRP